MDPETCDACAELVAREAGERNQWVLHWSSLPVRGMPTWVWGAQANAAAGAFGGAPYGVAARVRGVPNWTGRRHANTTDGALDRAP